MKYLPFHKIACGKYEYGSSGILVESLGYEKWEVKFAAYPTLVSTATYPTRKAAVDAVREGLKEIVKDTPPRPTTMKRCGKCKAWHQAHAEEFHVC